MGDYYPQQSKQGRSRFEALLSLATGAVAQPVSGLAGGLAAMLHGSAQGAQTVQDTQQAMTYAPRDPSSLDALGRAVQPVAAKWGQLRSYLGDMAQQHGAGPALSTAAYMVPDTLLALLGARGMGAKGPGLAQMVERSHGPLPGSAGAQIGSIGAWHGSPHDFDAFDMSKLGTGEGHQAYGHGLYFAGDKAIADHYRTTLSGRHVNSGTDAMRMVKLGDKPLLDQHPIEYDPKLIEHAKNGDSFGAWMHADETRAHWEDLAKDDSYPYQAYAAEKAKAWHGVVQDLHAEKPLSSAENGRLYNVELAPDETDLLDWDAPLHQQPEKVLAGIEKLVNDGVLDPDALKGWNASSKTGQHFYSQLQGSDNVTNAGHASQLMQQAGIPGIRYLDGGSRAAGDGSRNYVMFDDKLVKIKGKE